MPSKSIKLIIYLVALLGVTPAAWAGAAEEVAAIGQQRAAAFEKGDIDTYIAAFIDQAVFTPSVQAFRVEGKPALKNYFSALFETYPTRHIDGRQGSTLLRVYANDTIVVENAYFALTLTDKSGNARVHNLRGSATWLKIGQPVADRGSAYFRSERRRPIVMEPLLSCPCRALTLTHHPAADPPGVHGTKPPVADLPRGGGHPISGSCTLTYRRRSRRSDQRACRHHRKRSLPVLIAYPDPEGDPGEAATRAGARALAAAEAVCTAAGGSQKATRAADNKNGRCARVGDREARVDLTGVHMAETVDAGKTPLCFVIGPIGKDFSQERKHADLLLHAVIKHVLEAEEFGYKVKRADEEPDPGMIGDRVISDILHAQLVVADLTDLNPNAFYELGIRHSTMKPTIHLAKSGTPLPFDNVTHRTIFVDLAEWQSIERGRAQLAASARAIQDPGFQVSNPITQANASFKMRESADPLHRVIAEIGERVSRLEIRSPALLQNRAEDIPWIGNLQYTR